MRLTEGQSQEGISVKSMAAEMGEGRLSALCELVGDSKAHELCQRAGRYFLSEEIAAQVERRGARLGEEGEFCVLSPEKWLDPKEGSGVMRVALGSVGLPSGTRQSVTRFLSAFGFEGLLEKEPAFVLKVLRHYFFNTSLKVRAPTRQRD